MTTTNILALSGGVGGAKLVSGLHNVLGHERLTVIANTGDDQHHMGLLVCPDIDTLVYTLAGLNDTVQGWGRVDESWHCMQALEQLGGETWFQLGDKDIATHLKRNSELAKGKTLTAVTADISKALGVATSILPMCNESVSTQIEAYIDDNTLVLLPFHDYFVKYRCEPRIKRIVFNGSEKATISPEVDASIDAAGALVVCPSNPFLSIDPIFAVPGLQDCLKNRIDKRVVVSPIIAGQAVKGPTAKIMQELQLPCNSLAIAHLYKGFASHFVLDVKDKAFASEIEAMGLNVLVTQTLMKTRQDKTQLATDILSFIEA